LGEISARRNVDRCLHQCTGDNLCSHARQCCVLHDLRRFVFFFNDTATTEIYTLSLHDALPIWPRRRRRASCAPRSPTCGRGAQRSEEHTSELQSRGHLVCRLLLEKKKAATWAVLNSDVAAPLAHLCV